MISALLADDSISELEMMLYLIKKENLPLQAATAEDGEQALQYIQHHFVDLLITDIRMPFLDGLALCRKALEINPEMKIIIISGYDEFSYAKGRRKKIRPVRFPVSPLRTDFHRKTVSYRFRRCRKSVPAHRG